MNIVKIYKRSCEDYKTMWDIKKMKVKPGNRLAKYLYHEGGSISNVFDYTEIGQGKSNYYAMDTKILHLWDGRTTSPVIFIHKKGDLFVTTSGNIYLVVPTHVKTMTC